MVFFDCGVVVAKKGGVRAEVAPRGGETHRCLLVSGECLKFVW